MKNCFTLFLWLASLAAVQAQRVFPVTGGPSFASNDTLTPLTYTELNEPYVPNETGQTATVLIHVLDQQKRPYSGYLFKLEYKDFQTGAWHTYHDYQTVIAENDGTERLMPLIHQLPNGYYRVWAQCLRTKRIGTEPLLLNVEKDLPEPIQFTLMIPQTQDWLPKE